MDREPTANGTDEPRILTVTEAVRSFSEVINRAVYRGEAVLLTRGGKPVARLVPAAERRMPTAEELSRRLAEVPHLDRDDAEAFARDVEEGRETSKPEEHSPWD